MSEEGNSKGNLSPAAEVDGGNTALSDAAQTEVRLGYDAAIKRIEGLAAEVQKSEAPISMTVRALLNYFGYQRRGAAVVETIDAGLDSNGLVTDPDYRIVSLDSSITIMPVVTSPDTNATATSEQQAQVPTNFDPTYRLRRLSAASNVPVSVSPQRTVKEALTIMMAKNFSQLPVMSGERSVDGVISFSSIAKRSVLGATCEIVQDCLEPAHVVKDDTLLFEVINDIINHEYVLVQRADRKITGIVTTSDLSLEFREQTEPFLLVSEIELHIRALIERGRFTPDELSELRDERDTARAVSKVSDLTFGEYVRLFENPTRWQRLQLGVDRAEFVKPLREVQQLRNEIMHFDPDPFEVVKLNRLRDCVAFLQSLRKILYR